MRRQDCGDGDDEPQPEIFDAGIFASMQEVLASGVLEANLTVGPALHFAGHANLVRRILQPRFVVVIGAESLRIATMGFVGEPLLGDRPSEKRTPFVVCLLTQNLMETSGVQIHINYRVRKAGPFETSILSCVSAEVPTLLDVAMNKTPSFLIPAAEQAQPQLLLAGVALPAGGVEERGDATYFRVEVTPADGRSPWTVRRRYQQFHELYTAVRPATNHLAAMSFPRRHLRPCVGERLENRRRGLETWLSEVVREAQSRQPGWLKPLCDFLETR